VADGSFSQGEFASLMVVHTILPNPWTYNETEQQKWHMADLSIRPLMLILEVLDELHESDSGSAYLKNDELVDIIVPLAGVDTSPRDIAEQISLYRSGHIDISEWPNCAPEANDRRMAKEFLLFLANFGFLLLESGSNRDEEKFCLISDMSLESLPGHEFGSIYSGQFDTERAVAEIQTSSLPVFIERQRQQISVVNRHGQRRFRSEVLSAYAGRCVVTDTTVPEVLEAAHIVPVRYGGTDSINNGICLRTDIHRLFDAGKLHIEHDGSVLLAWNIQDSPGYQQLARFLDLPPFVSVQNLLWRKNYL
jgi:hypothetical protein